MPLILRREGRTVEALAHLSIKRLLSLAQFSPSGFLDRSRSVWHTLHLALLVLALFSASLAGADYLIGAADD
ncbi:MAG: hypothetical protein ACOYMP_12320 [Nodosilinea sp.]